MKRMKSLKGSALTVLFCMAVLCTILCTACPNAAGGGGSVYVQVAYTELDGYLANTASADKVNYIEVTGVSKEDIAGKAVEFNAEAGELGKKILAAAPKKVALKLPGKVAGLESMRLSFYLCTNLVSLAGIPASVKDMGGCFNGCTSLTKAPVIPANVTNINSCFFGCTSLTESPVIPASVTDMRWCFYGCTSLTQAPAIPASVTDMERCFEGCTRLTKAPVIPESVTNMTYCFSGCSALKGVKLNCPYNGTGNAFENAFLGCTSLEDQGIKVKNDQLSIYKMNAGAMGTTAEKFSGF
ncbi:leucine-rich repeat domain-containing protein [Treponema sp. HNW]|uniref:leucine-rich repeat domain-containing protein n=1 Tax=Treponema sp. HNW TaxID=3116654 RepID=UPI003D0D52E0